MSGKTFRAMVVTEEEDGTFSRAIKDRPLDSLGDGEVLVKVIYSSLNYKDALSATGNKGVTKKYPHTPGVDAAGIVEESSVDTISPGSEVIVTSYDLGMNTPGGYGGYIRVPASWVVPLPKGLSLKESMILGTAGLTAGMSVAALVEHVAPDMGRILVTGASGGVGSLTVAILAKLGYSVTAVSGKVSAGDFLKKLGAGEVIDRKTAAEGYDRPLLKSLWAGVVDTVGGEILVAAIKSTQPLGVVTCCGNVASPELPLNVFPFILRGVSLVGIDSQNCPLGHRKEVWHKLALDWKITHLEEIGRQISLEDLGAEIGFILNGKQKGRVVVDMLGCSK
ncbi:YhdH/YhfP family quinone oxidoreductase [Desulforhopalus sp. IMCC35007]|uniref:YhdH/YhfP family quinone oxidoreductase n=1 Tax=Desulforhopalus sp. IMCC35007 TaxID=2569543 RepID=UPI0010AE4141|nr:YhdH/YhfP family quinone oxidoreductase [Desulforhopalus sp. IMCC35007]TKB09108.1 acryloyl-CoA reductase [Desulforhopalus sp. IMCC35007]